VTTPLRIVHVYNQLDPLNGGPPRVILGLAAGQRALGHHLTFVSADLPDLPAIQAFYGPHLDPLPPRVVLRRERAHWRGLPQLIKALREADVAHLHGIFPVPNVVVAHLCRLLGTPYVLTPHGSLHRGAMGEKRLKKLVGRYALGYGAMVRHAAAIHALNDDEIHGSAWPMPARIEVIPNGVFADEFADLPTPGTFRQTLPALGDDPYVLFLSRLHPGKGCAELGAAFSQLTASHPSLHLVAFGNDQGGKAQLEAAAEAGGWRERLHTPGLIGGRDKLAAFVDAAVYTLPSHHEGFSMAITEALASGTPVVITDTCHFPEVAEARAGHVVPLDPAAIAQGLRSVLDDPEAAAMGARGRALVLDQYIWPALAARVLTLYREIIQ
jgi:glycosyltransferase involved in cell wall biosynthesis